MENFKQNLGHIIRFHRKRIPLTQEELAERIGLTPGVVGQYERGETIPSLATLVLLIENLEIDPRTIFYDSDKSDHHFFTLCSLYSRMNDSQRNFLIKFAKLLATYDFSLDS